ncbi:1055_t:CDS:2, partial [Dentiscutata heterogama]
VGLRASSQIPQNPRFSPNLQTPQNPRQSIQSPQYHEFSNIPQEHSRSEKPVLHISTGPSLNSFSHNRNQFDQQNLSRPESLWGSQPSQQNNHHNYIPYNNEIRSQNSFENYNKHSSLLPNNNRLSPSGYNNLQSNENRNTWHVGSTSPNPERRSMSKSPLRLLIDEKNARRQTATSKTLASDESAIQKYREAAKKTNDPAIQIQYAKFLLHMVELRNSNLSKNLDQEEATTTKLIQEAIYWIKLLAKSDYPEALYIKGTWYEYGLYGKEKNDEKAFKLYQTSSKKEFPKAKYKVAFYHEKKEDYKRAIQFYKKAAVQGEVAALYRLSLIYMLGEFKQGVDYRKSLIYLKQAASKADEDCPDGAYVYGMILAKEWDRADVPDELVAPDDHEAKELIFKAANLGHVPALFKIGQCYEYGSLGYQPDPSLSVEYYKRAAEKGHVEADMALSKWYLCGAEDLEQNEALAYEHAEKAALKGLPTAEFAMGYFHENGIHVPKNPGVAMIWYTKAASHGNEDAKNRLAIRDDNTVTRKENEPNQLKKEKRPDKDKDCIIQ